MEATSNSLIFRPSLPSIANCRRPESLVLARYSRKDADDRRLGSRMVDENMIVLRKRIQEMKMVEMNHEAPAHWMDWEKRYYASYDEDVCESVGVLQRFLMSTRPSVALGMLVMVGVSVPTTAMVVLINLVEVGKKLADVIVLH